MQFQEPLIHGHLVKRYKRFFADVTLDDGRLVTAHCPNTGSMKTCGSAGDSVWLLPNQDPKRKLKFTWELTQNEFGFIGVNTSRTNHIVHEAITQRKIAELNGYLSVRKEVPYGEKSRCDFLLEYENQPKCWVEVKNVSLFQDTYFQFPDAVTSRGLKHLEELLEVKKSGDRAVVFFLVNRPEKAKFKPAFDIDPKFSEKLKEVKAEGVEVLAYQTKTNQSKIEVGQKVEMEW